MHSKKFHSQKVLTSETTSFQRSRVVVRPPHSFKKNREGTPISTLTVGRGNYFRHRKRFISRLFNTTGNSALYLQRKQTNKTFYSLNNPSDLQGEGTSAKFVFLVPSPYSEGTNRDAILIFHERLRSRGGPPLARMRKCGDEVA